MPVSSAFLMSPHVDREYFSFTDRELFSRTADVIVDESCLLCKAQLPLQLGAIHERQHILLSSCLFKIIHSFHVTCAKIPNLLWTFWFLYFSRSGLPKYMWFMFFFSIQMYCKLIRLKSWPFGMRILSRKISAKLTYEKGTATLPATKLTFLT